MPQRDMDWLEQAKKDLEQAKSSKETEHHEWSCFISQQASEKAVKALYLSKGQQAWGHTVAKLLGGASGGRPSVSGVNREGEGA